MTVETSALLLPLANFRHRSVNHQKLPIVSGGIEAARAFERLMDEAQLTQEAVAERTGKDRATVANAIRLLKLEPKIQDWIEEGKLSAGHGRALLAVPDSQLRMRYAQRAARGHES